MNLLETWDPIFVYSQWIASQSGPDCRRNSAIKTFTWNLSDNITHSIFRVAKLVVQNESLESMILYNNITNNILFCFTVHSDSK